MAFVSLFSCPPNPVLHKSMPGSELAGDEREDGELEDGEIDDEGIGIEEKEEDEVATELVQKDKEKEREKDDKPHRHSHKRSKKIKEKRKSKRRRRDRQKHHSPSSDSSSDSYDSEYEHQERSKSKKTKGTYRDYDGQFAHHEQGHEPSGGHGKPQRSRNSESEDTHDFDEDQDDFSEELSKYKHAKESKTLNSGRTPKDHLNRPAMTRQQFGGQRGRGRGGGGGLGRGRGALSKNKNQNSKTWSHGRGRGGEHGGDGAQTDAKGQQGFQKKRPMMSQEFISQHTIEHNGRNICKYFIEGRCIKGDQCKFEHDNVVPEKKKELCKFYVQGYCTKGENCIYMHNEYPCKFFHTGAKCYQGDYCKFSHDPLTEITKELLAKTLNTDEDHAREDDLELEDLRKKGIAPLPKPPPGMGLLPTPGAGSPQEGSKKIPSLFEIKVLPTVDLAHKIALRPSFYNSTSPPPAQFQESEGAAQFTSSPEDMQAGTLMSPGHNHLPPSSGSPGTMCSPSTHFPVPGLPQSPHRHLPPQGFGQGPPIHPGQHFHADPQHLDHQNLQIKPGGSAFQSDIQMQMNMPFFKNLFSSHSLGLADEGTSGFVQDPQLSSAESHSGMQDLLPAVQKVLLLHLNQNQDLDSHRPDIQGHVAPGKVKDESTNWYSSDDEDGSSVTAILKTLKQQNEMLKAQQSQTNLQQLGLTPATHADPRLHKERASTNDPRVKVEFKQHALAADVTVLDPRMARDPRKVKPIDPNSSKVGSQHPPPHPVSSSFLKTSVGEEDEEGERELREKAALIPLEPSPGATLRDPRCQIKQFSHIRVDILLQRPAFAHSVVWAPEDLIPLLIPRQDPSINLPLPPLIADAQLNCRLSSPPDHPHSHSSSLGPPDPRLVASRLKEGVARLNSPPGRTLESRLSADKPADPRTHKMMLDPRISRSVSLDSKLPSMREGTSVVGVADPRLQQGCRAAGTSAKPDSEKLPPYAPHLASSGRNGLESPTSLLGGISLYDPRHHTVLSPKREAEEPLKKVGILKQPVRNGSPSPPHLQAPSPPPPPPQAPQAVSAAAAAAGEKDSKASDEQSENQCSSQVLPTEELAPSRSPVPVAATAMHNLPIPPLAGLMRPTYPDPRLNRQSGQTTGAQDEQERDEDVDEEEDKVEDDKKDRLLKDVFKTFDPTASPFCQ